MSILERLFAMKDEDYAIFQAKLMPTVNAKCVIGVRSPVLRALAKELRGSAEAESFLQDLPHQYYEENMLHGFLIEQIKDYDACIEALDEYLPYVDNWACCDCMKPKVLKKQPEKLKAKIYEWVKSPLPYTVRYAMGLFMSFYLDELFETAQADAIADYRSDEYYVKMMQAWYFATALAKQYELVLPYIKEQRLDKWTHNKAIQKAIESYRISAEQKTYLKTLKIK